MLSATAAANGLARLPDGDGVPEGGAVRVSASTGPPTTDGQADGGAKRAQLLTAFGSGSLERLGVAMPSLGEARPVGPSRWSTRSVAVKDLRISITDRCNFRCTYCMPEEGMHVAAPRRAPHLRGARPDRPGAASSASASTSIRLTGGEPTVRAHLPVLVAMLAPLGVDLAMTTNGVTLPRAGARPRRRRAAAHQHLARLAAARALPASSPGATSSTGCSPASTPRSTPGSTR